MFGFGNKGGSGNACPFCKSKNITPGSEVGISGANKYICNNCGKMFTKD